MKKCVIVYFSSSGNTAQMAEFCKEEAEKAGLDTSITSVESASVDMVAQADVVCLGCPAMGNEVLDEGEFEPFFTQALPALNGKSVILFGSYGWGDGQWMRDWSQTCMDNQVKLVGEGVICCGAPDQDVCANFQELFQKVAS